MFRSNLIPHNQFHKGYWYKSDISKWYYFKYQDREFNIHPNFDYSLVDKDILSLVKLFHSKGIPTTPSCSGHELPIMYFKELYQGIIEEQNIINTSGLTLINSETGESCLFQDSNYKFEYTEQSFLQLIQPYSQAGVLGVLGDFSYIKDIKGLEVQYIDGITLFLSQNNTGSIWKNLENSINIIWNN